MQDTLVIFPLKITSSYAENKEMPTDKPGDTLQFYAHGQTIWRIRTYSLDHDMHLHQIPLQNRTVEETLAFLISSSKEHYGDLISGEFTFQLDNPQDGQTAETFFTEHNLHAKLESTEHFAYWNPDGGAYSNKSNPLG